MKLKTVCTRKRPSCAGVWGFRAAAITLSLSLTLAGPAAADTLPITTQSGAVSLAGTLERAEDPRAVALILPGSGPTDRNGNSVAGINSDAYRLLAEGLAADGITTARIDKRGRGESAGDVARGESVWVCVGSDRYSRCWSGRRIKTQKRAGSRRHGDD